MTLRPQDKPCFEACKSCYRCEKKNSSSCPSPYSCSGRREVLGGHRWDSGDRDDACRCKEGILQMRLKSGRLVKRKYESSPFGGSVKTDVETQDERDWNSYVADQRELRDDPEYDPIRFDDGSGASSLSPRARGGGA